MLLWPYFLVLALIVTLCILWCYFAYASRKDNSDESDFNKDNSDESDGNTSEPGAVEGGSSGAVEGGSSASPAEQAPRHSIGSDLSDLDDISFCAV